uniref:Cytochrome c oxidase subunit 3 n=1 Tax=Megalothorax incertus TaxID=2579793 RepID=A0A8E8L9H4_9HEXA|nr:cytochrome c oxidase subunit III [Megalothorax incertus]
MLIRSNHIFHMVDQSPWPITGAIGAMALTTGMAQWFNANEMNLMLSGVLLLIVTAFQWWRDVSREATLQGLHTSFVAKGLRLGMLLFILSEVFFFFSFFWAFFHSSLAPTFDTGAQWPPAGIITFNPTQVPLLNTIILLASGVSVTWAHHALMEGKASETSQALFVTVILGLYFTALQALEYWEAFFSISDAVYGATFFVATGFHGLHVIIGTLFLMTCLARHSMGHFSPNHHFGFEAAAWYWHFVDVVWLFLYMVIYWWGH